MLQKDDREENSIEFERGASRVRSALTSDEITGISVANRMLEVTKALDEEVK